MKTAQKWFSLSFIGGCSTAPTDSAAYYEFDTSSWPTSETYVPKEGKEDKYLQTIDANDEHLDIKVGKGRHSRRFRVHKELICRHSDYFRTACQPSSLFRESIHSVFDLHEDNATAFMLFLNWLYGYEDLTPVGRWRGQQQTEPWTLYAVEAYVLADKFVSEGFARFAFLQVTRYAHLLDVHDLELIYKTASENTPIYRFASHWVRYRRAMEPYLWRESQILVPQKSNRFWEDDDFMLWPDPRRFKLEHWYSGCENEYVCMHLQADSHVDLTMISWGRISEAKKQIRRSWQKRDVHNPRTLAKITAPVYLFR